MNKFLIRIKKKGVKVRNRGFESVAQYWIETDRSKAEVLAEYKGKFPHNNISGVTLAKKEDLQARADSSNKLWAEDKPEFKAHVIVESACTVPEEKE